MGDHGDAMSSPAPQPLPDSAPLALDFHGVGVRVTTDAPEIARALGRDFSYFRVARTGARPTPSGGVRAGAGPAHRGVAVEIHGSLTRPPWDDLPAWPSVLVQPGFCAFQRGHIRWVDYQGRALARWDFDSETGGVWSEDPDLLHELLYLLVLSRAGELLDGRGLHRVHALALEVGGRATLCLLPSGGGKTTLGVSALRQPGVRLIGDDMALVDRRGRLLPFPLRLGFSRPPPGVEPGKLRRMRRREHGDKWLLDLDALGGRLTPAHTHVRPHRILVGRRLLAGPPHLERAPATAALPHLAREMVVGLGLPQLVEYFLRLEAGDLARKARLAASRVAAAGALTARSEVYRFALSRDREANAGLLVQLLMGPSPTRAT